MPKLQEVWFEEDSDYSNPICLSKPVYQSYLIKGFSERKVKVDGKPLLSALIEESIRQAPEEVTKRETQYLREVVRRKEEEVRQVEKRWKGMFEMKETELRQQESRESELRRKVEIAENRLRHVEKEEREIEVQARKQAKEVVRLKDDLQAAEKRMEAMSSANTSLNSSLSSYKANLNVLEARVVSLNQQNKSLQASIIEYEASIASLHQMHTEYRAKEMKRFEESIRQQQSLNREKSDMSVQTIDDDYINILKEEVRREIIEEELPVFEKEVHQKYEEEFGMRLEEEVRKRVEGEIEKIEETYKEVWVRREVKVKEANDQVDLEFKSVLSKLNDKLMDAETRVEASLKEKVILGDEGSNRKRA